MIYGVTNQLITGGPHIVWSNMLLYVRMLGTKMNLQLMLVRQNTTHPHLTSML